jgi:hypothetical protein
MSGAIHRSEQETDKTGSKERAQKMRRDQRGFISDTGMAVVSLFTSFATFMLVLAFVFKTVNHVGLGFIF